MRQARISRNLAAFLTPVHQPFPLRTLNDTRQLQVPTESVRHLHLARCPALRTKQFRTTHQDAACTRPRRRDVEPKAIVEELHPPRCILWARGRHGVDDDRRLLALEAIDGADPLRERRQCLHQRRDLGVVGSDDEDASFRQRADRVLLVSPAAATGQVVDELPYDFDLLRRSRLVSRVPHGHVEKPRAREV